MPNHVTNKITFECDEVTLRKIYERFKYDDEGKNEYCELGTIDFNKVIPMPESLMITEGSETTRGVELYLTAHNPDVYWFGDEKMESGEFSRLVQKLNGERIFSQYNTELQTEKIMEIDKRGDIEELMKLGGTAVDNLLKYGSTTWYNWHIENWGTKWSSYGYSYDWDEKSGIGNEITFDTAWSPPVPIFEKMSEMYPEVRIVHQYADEDIGRNCGEVIYHSGEIIDCYQPDADSKEAYELAAEVLGVDLKDYDLYLKPDSSGYEYREENAAEIDEKQAGEIIF